MKKSLCFLLAAISGMVGHADILSMNFTDAGSGDSTLLTADLAGAGAARAANWNNVAGGASGSGIALPLYDDGSASTATFDFTTDLGNWRLGHAVSDGDDRMWKGYLDVNTAASATFNNLEFVGP